MYTHCGECFSIYRVHHDGTYDVWYRYDNINGWTHHPSQFVFNNADESEIEITEEKAFLEML
jgi:hypothetical protein